MKRPKVERSVCQAPSTLLIAHLQKIASPPALLPEEPSPTLASVNNLSILNKLKCALCSNVLSQPLELTCSALVCTKCLTECIAASAAVSCPFCSDDDLSHVRPASSAILLCCYQMLEDIVLVVTGTLEVVIMKGMSVYHHLHLRSKLLSCCRGPSLPVPTKPMTFMQVTKASNKPQPPAQGPDALKCREYEVLSVEKHLPSSKQKFSPSVMKSDNVYWLATASISSSIEIGPAQVEMKSKELL
ncbi:hypothetical protein EMCRGX_G028329 [Ephydatia muelleri]